MAIPNTTPTPNELYNGEMRKMNDTQLRVVLIVTRATLGWVIDKKTGMRKTEDWIAHTQLIRKSGRSSPAISRAINICVNRGWIETRDKDGNLLKTSSERGRRKVFYRLGRIFMDKISAKESLADEDNNENLPNLTRQSAKLNDSNLPKKVRNTKETIYKRNITKVATLPRCDLQKLIELFKPINPSYKKLFPNTTQRKALQRLVDKFGYSEVQRLLEALPTIVVKKYAPRITTPLTLENKLGDLFVFMKQEKSNKSSITII